MVLGSTGLIGSKLVAFLSMDSSVDLIVCPVRSAKKNLHSNVLEVEINFKDENSIADLPKVEMIYCCLGTTIKKAGSRENFRFVDYELPIAFANWGIKNKVHTYAIVTALGADAKSLVFYNKVKGEVEQKLKEFNFENLNIFRPSLLVGEREENRFGEKIAEKVLNIFNPLLRGDLKKYKAIKGADVAKAMTINNKKGLNIFLSDEIQELAACSNI